MVHRLIKKLLLHPTNFDEELLYYDAILSEICNQNSISERKAIECERAVNDMLYAWYIERYIKKEYSGIITSIAIHIIKWYQSFNTI